MSDQMLQPHYVKISAREGWMNYCDGRRVDGTPLPHKFKDWWEANDWINRHQYYAKLFPYYPEWADFERRYIDQLIAKEEASFARITGKHEETLGGLIAEKEAVPA